MAKRKNHSEELIYCSGPNWDGDGSKNSSPCKFGESMITSSQRFKCSYCCVGLTPSAVSADRTGPKLQEVIMVTKTPEQIENTEAAPSEAEAPEVEVEAPEVEAEAPEVEAEAPEVEVEAPEVEVEAEAPEVEAEAPAPKSKKVSSKPRRRRRF